MTVTVKSGATINDIVSLINSDADTKGVFLASNANNGKYTYSTLDNDTYTDPLSGAVNTTTNANFKLTAVNGKLADGTKGNDTQIKFTAGNANAAVFDSANNILNITVAAGATVQDIADKINADGNFQATDVLSGNSLFGSGNLGTLDPNLLNGTDSYLDDVITITADSSGAALDLSQVNFVEDSGVTAGQATAAVANGKLTVTVNNLATVNLSTINDAIDKLAGYSSKITATAGDGVYDPVNDKVGAGTITTAGKNGGGLIADLTIQLTGGGGSEVFSFKAGSSIDNIVQSINLVKDATGVQAEISSGHLKLTSTGYGSSETVAVEVISEGAGGQFKNGLSAANAKGADVVATVNGYLATGEGNTLSVNTATLDLSVSVAAAQTGTISFDITGGGALFQLGPDVVSNQQARLGVGSLNTAKLGSANGRLYELSSGASKSLVNDATGASKVINDVIAKVTTLRGRLGAFQRTTLDSNSVSLTETLSNLNEAQSSIRDADFAKESANLTRAQILVQSGTQVLQLANQSPQNVLSLLR